MAQDSRPLDIQLGCSAFSTYKPPAYGGNHKWTINDDEAEFLILKFDKFRLPATDFLTLRDVNSDTVEYIYGNQTSGEFITKAIDSKTLELELHIMNAYIGKPTPESENGCLGYGFQVSQYRYETTTIHGNQTICGRDNSLEAQCYSRAARKQYNLAKAVLRLTIHKARGSFYCTGWLVGCEGHIMTNEHCIGSQYHANNIRIEAMAERSCRTNCKRGGACRGRIIATSARLIAVSKVYDYAMIKPNTALNLNRDYGYLKMRSSAPRLYEKVYVPQHPAGYGKRIAFVTDDRRSVFLNSITKLGCNVRGSPRDELGYMADTRGGSSGSPVLSRSDDLVVGLHHCGGCPNVAVRSERIVRDLQSKRQLPRCAASSSRETSLADTDPVDILVPGDEGDAN